MKLRGKYKADVPLERGLFCRVHVVARLCGLRNAARWETVDDSGWAPHRDKHDWLLLENTNWTESIQARWYNHQTEVQDSKMQCKSLPVTKRDDMYSEWFRHRQLGEEQRRTRATQELKMSMKSKNEHTTMGNRGRKRTGSRTGSSTWSRKQQWVNQETDMSWVYCRAGQMTSESRIQVLSLLLLNVCYYMYVSKRSEYLHRSGQAIIKLYIHRQTLINKVMNKVSLYLRFSFLSTVHTWSVWCLIVSGCSLPGPVPPCPWCNCVFPQWNIQRGLNEISLSRMEPAVRCWWWMYCKID